MASVLLRVGARHLPRLAAINATQRAAPIVAMAANRLDVLSTTAVVNRSSSLQEVTKRFAGHWSAEQPHHTKAFIQDRIMLVLQLFDKIDPNQLTPDSHFINDLGLDSLDHVEIIHMLEEEFMFEFPDEHWENLHTVNAVKQYVCDRFDVFH